MKWGSSKLFLNYQQVLFIYIFSCSKMYMSETILLCSFLNLVERNKTRHCIFLVGFIQGWIIKVLSLGDPSHFEEPRSKLWKWMKYAINVISRLINMKISTRKDEQLDCYSNKWLFLRLNDNYLLFGNVLFKKIL